MKFLVALKVLPIEKTHFLHKAEAPLLSLSTLSILTVQTSCCKHKQ